MGLARVMEQLGMLKPLGKAPPTGLGGVVVKLGHDSPRNAYQLAFDKQIIEYVIAKCAAIDLPSELTTAALVLHTQKLIAHSKAEAAQGKGGAGIAICDEAFLQETYFLVNA